MTFSVPGFREVPLRRRVAGIDGFRIDALIDSDPVRAVWDGRCLRLSEQLYGLAQLAATVDDVYVAAGLARTHNRSTLGGGPEAVMLTLINCCDALGVVEYSSAGQRHVFAP